MESLDQWLNGMGLSRAMTDLVVTAMGALAVILLMVLAHVVARQILLRLIERIIAKTTTQYDDMFVREKVFHRAAHLVPAIILHLSAPVVFARYETAVDTVETAAFLYFALVILGVVFSILNAILGIYSTTRMAARLPIKPIIQVTKFIGIFALTLVVISTLLGKSPLVLLSGLGAFTAVLLLIFRDPIMGLAAGFQLVSNDMVRPGDWIEVPKFGADGDVIDVSLTTVSVQNWDKTISTIPTYALFSDTFRNWRGMTQSGGRRIKRSVFIDMSTIRFCDDELLEQLKKIQHVRAHIETKLAEITAHNREHGYDESLPVNGRRLTNIGIFRAYLQAYLHNKPEVHPDLTFLVRQLQPTATGLPIEIYVFSKNQAWAAYEGIQADIFDHVLAAVPLFDLRVFQEPSGADLRSLSGRCNPAR
jgi:miniconductance mechanosensitive channel